MFYLTGFNAIAHKADEPRPYAVILSRHAPERPILVIADYYLATFLKQPTWVEDIRPFRAVMMPLDLPPTRGDIDRFIPGTAPALAWVERARASYAFDMGSAVRGALRDLKLDRGRVAFDDMGAGFRLGVEGMQVADGYDPLMFARAVKTRTELRLLERSTRLNETAIRRTMASWQKGATWRDLNKAYAGAVTDLGGFVRDPGAMVWGHPRGADPTLTLATGLEDDEVDARHARDVRLPRHHRSLLLGRRQDLGGRGRARGRRQAASPRRRRRSARRCSTAMRPGARISELQARAREVYRRAGVPDPASAVIFFHGLGLSHMDIEQTLADGSPNGDWVLEENMVAPVHLLYPGGEHERVWLEEVVHITKDGGRPLFSWGFEPLVA